MTLSQTTARTVVLALLSRARTGQLVLVEPDGRSHTFGPGGEPSARVEMRDIRMWTELMHGSRGLAEAYSRGWWESPDLVAVVRVGARNVTLFDAARRKLAPLRKTWRLAQERRNTLANSRYDIHRHYDLGNELFEVMLDDTMMYSAGAFATPETSLRDASLAKLELVCDKLALGPDDHVIEIGTGWGGFAVHAATTRGCRVTTTTISAEQHAYADERVARAGVADRRVSTWLDPGGGKAFVHVFSHRTLPYRFVGTRAAERFFTAGLMPSHDLMERFGDDLVVADRWAVSGTHYQRTLEAWLERLDARSDEALALLGRGRSRRQAKVLLGGWRLFLLSTQEIWGYQGGDAWLVSHYLLEPRRAA